MSFSQKKMDIHVASLKATSQEHTCWAVITQSEQEMRQNIFFQYNHYSSNKIVTSYYTTAQTTLLQVTTLHAGDLVWVCMQA
jgi:hypothetical protein